MSSYTPRFGEMPGRGRRAALKRKHGVGYNTVAAALQSAWPEPRKKQGKRGSRLDPYREVIDGWLHNDLDAPRKH